MSDGMGREFTYLSSHATNRYFIPNWGNYTPQCIENFPVHKNYSYLCLHLSSRLKTTSAGCSSAVADHERKTNNKITNNL